MIISDSSKSMSEWVDAGCPTSGDWKEIVKKAVCHCINTLEVIRERKRESSAERETHNLGIILSTLQSQPLLPST